jgi:hypothetical protein
MQHSIPVVSAALLDHINTGSVFDHRRVALVPIRDPGETVDMFKESRDLKKAFSVRVSNGESYPLRREMVYCFFDIPSVEAARIMRVSLSLLKKIRTWVNVERWPCSQLHSGEFIGLTRAQVIAGRDEVILGLEKEYKENPGRMIQLALKIMKEVREYAITYACLVTPDSGRRPMVRNPLPRTKDGGKKSKEMPQSTENAQAAEERLKEIMDSMQPRQVVKRKTKVSVVTTVEPEDTGCFWPICITQEFNFDLLYQRDDEDSLDDELKLGPLTLSSVSSTVAIGRGNDAECMPDSGV